MNQRLEAQMNFILEMDKTKQILRQTYIADTSRPENDAEHAWHLGLMTMVLSEYSNEPVNVERVIKMVLIHDLIEIDAGDTYAYDPEANKTKRARELAAAERIFHILPSDQAKELRALWDEFEEAQTADAKFANAMDVLQPVMMNDIGHGLAWLEHGVKEEQARTRIARIKPGSERLFQYCSGLIDRNVELGNIQKNPANQV